MNVYFSCSITGGRDDQTIYQQIVEFIQGKGHEIPTAHLAFPDLEKLETNLAPEDVYKRDIDWVRGCDVLVAEVSTPSHGVGYEIAEAVIRGKTVLCVYRKSVRVSKIITGNTEPNIRVFAYSSTENLLTIIDEFLSEATSIYL